MIYIHVAIGREIFFSMTHHPLAGKNLLIIETSRSHSDTPPSVGLLCTSNQPDAITLLDNTQHSQEIYNHAPGGIQAHSPRKRVAAEPRHSPRGHQVRREDKQATKCYSEEQSVPQAAEQARSTGWQQRLQ